MHTISNVLSCLYNQYYPVVIFKVYRFCTSFGVSVKGGDQEIAITANTDMGLLSLL